jgi:hypothetical protein
MAETLASSKTLKLGEQKPGKFERPTRLLVLHPDHFHDLVAGT